MAVAQHAAGPALRTSHLGARGGLQGLQGLQAL